MNSYIVEYPDSTVPGAMNYRIFLSLSDADDFYRQKVVEELRSGKSTRTCRLLTGELIRPLTAFKVSIEFKEFCQPRNSDDGSYPLQENIELEEQFYSMQDAIDAGVAYLKENFSILFAPCECVSPSLEVESKIKSRKIVIYLTKDEDYEL
jgi:hypothetical protein